MDKQIEELTNDIIKSLSTEYIYAQSEVMEHLSDIRVLVSSLISKRWRKIPENAVVLTIEQYENIATLPSIEEADTKCSFHIILDKVKEIASKETAEKYHTKVNEAIDSVPNATKEFVEAWKAKNDKIAKEITEG